MGNRLASCAAPADPNNPLPSGPEAYLRGCGQDRVYECPGDGCLRPQFWRFGHRITYTDRSGNCGWIYGDGTADGAHGLDGIYPSGGTGQPSLCMPQPYGCSPFGAPYPLCAWDVFFDQSNLLGPSTYGGHACQITPRTECDGTIVRTPRFTRWPSPATITLEAANRCRDSGGEFPPNADGFRPALVAQYASSFFVGDIGFINSWVARLTWGVRVVPHYAYARSLYEFPVGMRTFCDAAPPPPDCPGLIADHVVGAGEEPGCNPHSFTTGAIAFQTTEPAPPPDAWPVNIGLLDLVLIFTNRGPDDPPDTSTSNWWAQPHEVYGTWRPGSATFSMDRDIGNSGLSCCRSSSWAEVRATLGGWGPLRLFDVTNSTPGYRPEDNPPNPGLRKFLRCGSLRQFSDEGLAIFCVEGSAAFSGSVMDTMMDVDIGPLCAKTQCRPLE